MDIQLDRIENKLNSIMGQLDAISGKAETSAERLVTLEKIVAAAVPRTRRTKAAQTTTYTPVDLIAARLKEMARVFDKLTTQSSGKRKAQNFPSYLIESVVDESRGVVFGACPKSILANRCSLLKIFQPVVAHNESSASENAYAMIVEANRVGLLKVDTVTNAMIVRDYDQNGAPLFQMSDTEIVMGKECVARLYGSGPAKVERKEEKKSWPFVAKKEEVTEKWVAPPKKQPVVEEPEWEEETACSVCGDPLMNGECENCKIVEL